MPMGGNNVKVIKDLTFAAGDKNVIVINSVDKPVFFGNSAAPKTR